MKNSNLIRFIIIFAAGFVLALIAGQILVPGKALNTARTQPQKPIVHTAQASIDRPRLPKTCGAVYPYRGEEFARFVDDSFREGRMGTPDQFYSWMEKAYQTSWRRHISKAPKDLDGWLRLKREKLSNIRDNSKKAEAEMATGAELHKLVKTAIPNFSLDRGFEFYNVVKNGERQCFLQSVLISGLLQEMGVNAGIAMVYKNTRGEQTNNGHAVALVKLANGKDIIVDASEQEPFARQQGLFASVNGQYNYIDPVFEPGSFSIGRYRPASGGGKISTSAVRSLDYSFIHSQFYYYRGERATGGIVSSHKNRKGLRMSQRYLQKSVELCPQNPLSVYMLGRTCSALGDTSHAQSSFTQAKKLYTKFGWVPAGLK